jgi:hypothetical protein
MAPVVSRVQEDSQSVREPYRGHREEDVDSPGITPDHHLESFLLISVVYVDRIVVQQGKFQ